MKKLFLLAILLGLSGCGDNSQSDTSQSNTQTNLLQTTELETTTVSNYNLTASSLMMSSAIAPLGGWSITNSTVIGASKLIDAAKDTRVSAALVTPNAKQVAEVLRGGVAGVALAIAIDQLLGAVDWVLDPANNQIIYKSVTCNVLSECPPQYEYFWNRPPFTSAFFAKPEQVCELIGIQRNQTVIQLDKTYQNGILTGVMCRMRTASGGRDQWSLNLVKNTFYDPNKPQKTLPLEAVAEQVITNADSGSLDAQVATNAATQNILNDAVQAEPVVQELEKNADNKCPSGITNGNGDCWVCSRESWVPIRGRVVRAKDITNGLGGCSAGMNSSQLLTRYNAYTELGASRDAENACWSPQDQEHLIQARMAKATANDCKSYLGILGQ